MMNFLSCILISFLCAFGFICFIYCIAETFFCPRAADTFLLVPLAGAQEDAEMLIKQAKQQRKHMCGNGKHYIIILDNGMDEMARAIAEKEAEISENIYICRADELKKIAQYSKI